jgi:putative membrane protein
MSILATILVAVIAVLHLYIMWFEMFAWETRGPKVFSSVPAELFAPTKTMAANQGLYNGFLAAGLLWSLCIGDAGWQSNVAVFFLLCVAVAGLYGAATVSKRIAYVQTVPAVAALLVILIS